MTRLQCFIFCLFAVSMGTGVMVGMGLARAPKAQAAPWLADELQLTSAQQDEMRKIWTDTLRGVDPSIAEKRRLLAKERDDKILDLIPEEKKHSYELIVQLYSQQVVELNRSRDAAFEEAVASTMKILDGSQQEKYKALVNKGFRTPWGRSTTTRAALGRTGSVESQPLIHP